jgi:transcriptional regulator with XRE-family HTH domain
MLHNTDEEGSHMTLGERLKKQRLQRGYTQSQLADEAHVSQGLIARIENNHVRDPSSGVLRRIARALAVSMDYLAGVYDDETDDALTTIGVSP